MEIIVSFIATLAALIQHVIKERENVSSVIMVFGDRFVMFRVALYVPQVYAIVNLVDVLNVPTKHCMATIVKHHAVIIAKIDNVIEAVFVPLAV